MSNRDGLLVFLAILVSFGIVSCSGSRSASPGDTTSVGMLDGATSSGGDSNSPSTEVETIGASGGTLRADGVTVTIPPGALTGDVQLTLTVGPDALVTVSPDTSFLLPVRVKMALERWPVVGPRLAEHQTAGEFYLIGQVIESGDGSWEYATTEFSETRGHLVKTIAPSDLSVWVEGDCSVSVVESTQTQQPQAVTPSDVTRSCLTDIRTEIGPRHDPVTGPNVASRGQDEYNLMSKEAAIGLAATRAAVKTQLPGYDIWVNGAWDSSGGGIHGSNSNHYYGAALDLALCENPCADAQSKVTDPNLLGQLPVILLGSGFTWVYYEDPQHIHASISSPSLSDCKGLVASYPFNGNADDESGNGRNGSVNGATLTTDRFGKANSAYSFDGVSNTITLPFGCNLLSGRFAISVWFNQTKELVRSYQLGGCFQWTYQGLINADSYTGRGIMIATNFNYSGTYVVSCQVYDASASGPVLEPQLSPIYNSWHHLVLSYNGAEVGAYLDGSLAVSSPFSGPVDPNTMNFVVGQWVYSPFMCDPAASKNYSYFGGQMDDIRFYNRALSQQEIQALYTETRGQ